MKYKSWKFPGWHLDSLKITWLVFLMYYFLFNVQDFQMENFNFNGLLAENKLKFEIEITDSFALDPNPFFYILSY